MSWRENVREVEPYTPGEQPDGKGIIKLNTNENPYPPGPRVQQALQQLDAEDLRLYPDPDASALRQALAERYGVRPEQVFVGVGSDDVLATAFLTFFNSDRLILFPDVSYSFYRVWADCYRIPYQTVPLTEQWEIDPTDYGKENGGIIFPNPNAPTGLALPLSQIRYLLEKNPDVVVLVDEAYVDFGSDSALSLLPEYENLLVVQTFSKSRSLAGIRMGYAIGNQELIAALFAVRNAINSYTLNLPCQRISLAALQEEAYFRETVQKLQDTRDSVREVLGEMGFVCTESKANFLFLTHPTIPAVRIAERLRERQIYVRHFPQPRIDNWLRITVGTRKQMQTLLDALRHILREEQNA